jgi:glycosyltransferase involved in cell wall biosynthesis/predicted SAM-dependent methyltransferase
VLLGLWRSLRGRRRSRRDLDPGMRAQRRLRPRIGIVSAYTTRKGILTETRAVESVLAPPAEIFPAGRLRHLDEDFGRARAARVEPELHHDRLLRPGTRLAPWLRELDVAIFLERLHPRIFRECRRHGVRTVVIAHLDFLPADRAELEAGLRDVDLVVFHNEQGASVLRGLGFDRCVSIPPGLDWPVRRAPGSPDGCTFYLNVGVGGVENRRNVPLVIQTMNALLPRYPEARLVLKMLPQARKHLAGLGRLHERIEVVEERLPAAGMLELQARADVSLFPSRVEGVGYPLLESLQLGVPVVATDAPPMNEFVDDGRDGLLVRAKEAGRLGLQTIWDLDPEHFRAQLERLLGPGGRALRERLREGAAARAGSREHDFRAGWADVVRRLRPRIVNAGAGDDRVEGAINLDLRLVAGVDLVGDAARLPFADGCLDELVANDLIEHVPTARVGAALDEWVRVLRPRGRLRVQTPDLRAISRAYLRGRLDPERAVAWLYGAQDHPHNFHRTILDEPRLRGLLGERGIVELRRLREDVSSKNVCLVGRKR